MTLGDDSHARRLATVPKVTKTAAKVIIAIVAVMVVASACTGDPGNGLDPLPPPGSRPEMTFEPTVTVPPAEEPVSSVEESYQWEVLSTGAGGFVTGLDSNADGSVRLARTDVGGIYRWNDSGRLWQQLITFEGVQDPELSDFQIEAMAIAPSDPDRLYISTGRSVREPEGRVFASQDGGLTWVGAQQRFAIHANGDWRTSGERLAVDPTDPDVVLLGTRTEGLWRSTDGATTFERIDSVPVGSLPAGVRESATPAGVLFVVFSADGSTAWAGVSGVGVLRSEDGGLNWVVLVPGEGMPFDAEEGVDGRLWVVQRDPGKVWLVDGDSVSEINPNNDRRYETVSVDPFNPDRAIVGGVGIAGDLWITTSAGRSWDDLPVEVSCQTIPWLDVYPNEFLPTGSIRFDRSVQDQLWVPEGFAVWRGMVDRGRLDLVCEAAGIEELVSNDVVVPPGGQPVTAHWDRGVFWHGGTSAAEAVVFPENRFNSAWDLDWTPADPDFVAVIIGDQRTCCRAEPESFLSGYSEDGGQTWTPFGSYQTGQPEALVYGNIAVASNDPSNLVWLPTFNREIHFSTDKGNTWTPVVLPGTEEMTNPNTGAYAGGSHFQYFLNRKVLVADRIEPNTFYLYHRLGIFQSTDGGASWELLESEGLVRGGAGQFNASLVASPTEAGHLIFTQGLQESGEVPFYESTDGGATWRTVPGLSDVSVAGFGAPIGDRADPAVYLSGKFGGVQGIYRSVDGLSTWELISPAPLGNYQAIKAITGSLDEPGTVYVGFSGTSFMVGRSGPIEGG